MTHRVWLKQIAKDDGLFKIHRCLCFDKVYALWSSYGLYTLNYFIQKRHGRNYSQIWKRQDLIQISKSSPYFRNWPSFNPWEFINLKKERHAISNKKEGLLLVKENESRAIPLKLKLMKDQIRTVSKWYNIFYTKQTCKNSSNIQILVCL